jgi:regulator of RNase E activity RraA
MSVPAFDAEASIRPVELPIVGAPYERPGADKLAALEAVSSATASAVLHQMGIRQTFIEGPVARKPGSRAVGVALNLQFMPQREDVMSGVAQEEVEKYSALWAVLETVQQNDVLMIQAYGDPYTGCIGEMLSEYVHLQGGVGIVIDGSVRDWTRVQHLEIPVWSRGATPNYASQASLIPWAYNVPLAMSRVLVLPGDIVIADDDGVVAVPQRLADAVIEVTREKEGKEDFIRERLAAGGALRRYYPLSAEAKPEFEAWKAARAEQAQ